MLFHFEHLDIYQRSLDALDLIDSVIEKLPTGTGTLKDQLDRAAISVVANVTEGAGEFSRLDKQRFYRIAGRSATECAGLLQIAKNRRLAPPDTIDEARQMLARVVAMLVRLTKRGRGA